MNFALTVVTDFLAVCYSYSIIRPFLAQAAPQCHDAMELASRYYSSISQSLTYVCIFPGDKYILSSSPITPASYNQGRHKRWEQAPSLPPYEIPFIIFYEKYQSIGTVVPIRREPVTLVSQPSLFLLNSMLALSKSTMKIC
jgi:hypothetical protein